VNFFDGMAANIAGIDARLSPDLRDEDIAQFLAGRRRLERVAIRHTVGMDDRSRARAASPTRRKMPARAISSSSSTAIPNRMPRA
jgi:hypothetical protein